MSDCNKIQFLQKGVLSECDIFKLFQYNLLLDLISSAHIMKIFGGKYCEIRNTIRNFYAHNQKG